MESTTQDQQKNLRRVVVSSFPDFDATVGTILAFATFAVGFVARPVGGIIFGHFGDKLGRKKMLVLTLEIMGVATVGIMAFESAPEKKRAFYGSLPQVGLALGLMLASAVIGILSWALSEEDFLAWGWRVAFLLSAALVAVGAYIRLTVTETQDFAKAKKKTDEVRFPIMAAIRHYPKTLLACMGARFVEGIAFNVFGVFSLTYLTNTCGMDKTASIFIIVGLPFPSGA